jgi:hypothetical protein
VYDKGFRSTLAGTANAPITVRSYPGEWAILDGYGTTTLNGAISATATSITVTNGRNLAPGSELKVDNERLYIFAGSGNNFSVTRGHAGTQAASHANGALLTSQNDTLFVEGSHTIYRDFEVTNSNPASRVVQGTYIFPPRGGQGITVHGPNTKFINLVIHDTEQGIGFWVAAVDAEVYGCIIYNNGFVDSGRGHGHGLYIQNQTGTKYVRDVISVNNFGTGMKAFGEGGYAIGVTFDGVMSFNNGSPAVYPTSPAVVSGSISALSRANGVLVGTGTQPADRLTITNSYLYTPPGTAGGDLRLGYQGIVNNRITITNNYVSAGIGALNLENWSDTTVTGNTFHMTNSSTQAFYPYLATSLRPPGSTFNWNNNTYLDEVTPQEPNFGPFAFNGPRLTFNQWKQTTGFDSQSQYSLGRPVGVKTFVRPNQYEAGRAHIAVYNWDLRPTVNVDVSGILPIGAQYEVRSAQNYSGPPVLTGTYDGQLLPVPMTGLTVAPLIGLSFTPVSTAPEFNVFVLIKK